MKVDLKKSSTYYIMEAIMNINNSEQQVSNEIHAEKSELMQVFESQVNDMYWAYKDLLKAIFDQDQSTSVS